MTTRWIGGLPELASAPRLTAAAGVRESLEGQVMAMAKGAAR